MKRVTVVLEFDFDNRQQEEIIEIVKALPPIRDDATRVIIGGDEPSMLRDAVHEIVWNIMNEKTGKKLREMMSQRLSSQTASLPMRVDVRK